MNMDMEFHLLETITNNFSEDNKVGAGGYGEVYKAKHNGKDIAIKKLYQLEGLVDGKVFDNEFLNLSKVKHQNIVRLIGYCYESKDKFTEHNGGLVRVKAIEQLLCFEYMNGGSLDKYIKDESCDLEWTTCYQIIKGTCDGLNHLHSSQATPIFHLDLKPENILLDNNMTAKIADLGLSRLVASTKTHRTERKKGTHGYMPPEYVNNGDISKKFDVFSLGVIMLKLMDGNHARSRLTEVGDQQFIKHVCENLKKRPQAKSGNLSQQIDGLQVKTCFEIASRCVVEERNKRPLIKDIVYELEELEAKIKKMSLPAFGPKDLIGQRSCDTKVLAVDPTMELRFLFETRRNISCCLQLTNKTDGFIAFNVKINKSRYTVHPAISGIMPPCSKHYLSVTLPAQEAAPPVTDMFIVESAGVSEELVKTSGRAGLTPELFDKLVEEEKMVLDVVKMPIVYVVLDQFPEK